MASLTLSSCTCVRSLKRKGLELSTPNVVDIYSVVVPRLACIDPEVKRSKGQGHGVKKYAAGVGMHVDVTV